MNRIRTHDYTEYPITNQCKITIWNDKTFSISLTEDTVDLKAVEVKKLHRVVSAYMVEFTSLTHYLTKQLKFYESLIKPKIFFYFQKKLIITNKIYTTLIQTGDKNVKNV